MDKTDQVQPQEIQVTLPEEKRPGVYANMTNINLTNNEVVLNFIFVNAADTPQGTLVSRVIVTRQHAEQILDTLKSVVDTGNEVNPR